MLFRNTPAIRTLSPERRAAIREAIAETAIHTARAHGCEAQVSVTDGFPVTINDSRAVALGEAVARSFGGDDGWHAMAHPLMGAEDFSYMLEQRPGSYIFMGGGRPDAPLHSPQYDFNDEALTVGASYWARLVERLLPAG